MGVREALENTIVSDKPLSVYDMETALKELWDQAGDYNPTEGWFRIRGAMEWKDWGGLCRPTEHENVYQCTWAKDDDNIRDVKTTFLKIEDSGEANMFIPIADGVEPK